MTQSTKREALHIAYTKIGERRGRKNLWFEGKRLTNLGFEPGLSIAVNYSHDKKAVQIILSDKGHHTVSSRKKGEDSTPIININNEQINEIFGGIERIRTLFYEGMIIISVHPDDVAKKDRYDRLVSKLKSGDPINVGSVAHGGGILDHGLHEGLGMAGVANRLAFAVEIESKYLETSLTNNPIWDDKSMAIEAPMEQVEPWRLPLCEVFFGGIPCTGASVSGRAKNKLKAAEEHESAGALFLAYLNIVKAVNPAIVGLENVPQYGNTVSMTVIRNVLESWGYNVHETILEGNDFGSFEARKRLCMVAVSDGIDFDFAKLEVMRKREATLGEMLEDIPLDDKCWSEMAYLKEKEIKDKAAGKGFAMHIVDANAEAVNTIGRGYAKVRSTEVKIQHPENPDLLRQLTPIEHARVKAIPEYLIASTSNTTAHEILGQSVIHPAFVSVGKLIGDSVNALIGKAASTTKQIVRTIENTVSSDTIRETAVKMPADNNICSGGQLALGF